MWSAAVLPPLFQMWQSNNSYRRQKIQPATKRSPLSQAKRNLNRNHCRDGMTIGSNRWSKFPALDRFYCSFI
jgi:hypothetical protein